MILTIKETYKTISGVLTEKDEASVHPSINTEVSLKSDYINQSTITDNSGKFTFKIATKDFDNESFNSFTLYISEPEFTIIDTLFFNENKNSIQDISLQMIKLYTYFPLKVGNKWEYKAYGSHGDGSYQWIYNGSEKLEITDHYNDNSFTITCLVNGSEISKSPIESDRTTYINNKKYELKIKYENGKPVLIDCDSCYSSNYPVLRKIMLNYSLNFDHPVSTDTIKTEYGGQWDNYNYSLLINVGLTYFKSFSFDGLYSKSMSYKLISYDLK